MPFYPFLGFGTLILASLLLLEEPVGFPLIWKPPGKNTRTLGAPSIFILSRFLSRKPPKNPTTVPPPPELRGCHHDLRSAGGGAFSGAPGALLRLSVGG